MRTFSRWMPPAPRPVSEPAAWLLFGLLLSPLLVTAALTRGGKVVLALLVCLWGVSAVMIRRRLRRLAAGRSPEDVGTFARAFDRRREPFDPRVVRAVWEAVQPYATFRGGRVPVRATDRLDEDLNIDSDDVDSVLIRQVAERVGRSLYATEANPYFGRVATVGDLVRFLSAQPTRAAA